MKFGKKNKSSFNFSTHGFLFIKANMDNDVLNVSISKRLVSI